VYIDTVSTMGSQDLSLSSKARGYVTSVATRDVAGRLRIAMLLGSRAALNESPMAHVFSLVGDLELYQMQEIRTDIPDQFEA
jgi:hypothetical protein